MDNKNHIIRFIFYLSIILLLVIYLFPGSLIGYLLYGDFSKQLHLLKNPIGTSINHFICFFYLSTIGFIGYSKGKKFKKLVVFLFSLSVILEILHTIIPERSFEYLDLIANMSGVLLGYYIIKISKIWIKYE